LFVLALAALLLVSGLTEKKTYLGIPVLSQQQQADLGEYVYQDFSRELQ